MNDTLQKVFKTGQEEESGGGAIFGILILAVLIAGGLGLVKGCSKEDAKSAKSDAAEEATTPVPESVELPSDAAVNAAARKAVRWKLADPDSAKFRNVFVVAKPGQAKAVCGEVNAKNQMGGYAGYKRFISAGTVKLTYFEDDLADMDEAWRTLCTR
ncbi:hypothetical protein GVN21_07290 [Caulobacter sp. SLTY]|uniref:hypothetical protein n=1 Tax=Caulobacter sp. SLTY TaxID=2683262 RepID=UPI001412420B|nr:hypothetical protein [Caulobacter sp. SLTY]NBB15158.1 hypothetical protein [Caulobacter sp. SLTY]